MASKPHELINGSNSLNHGSNRYQIVELFVFDPRISVDQLKERKNFFFSRETPHLLRSSLSALRKICEIIIYLYQDELVERE